MDHRQERVQIETERHRIEGSPATAIAAASPTY